MGPRFVLNIVKSKCFGQNYCIFANVINNERTKTLNI